MALSNMLDQLSKPDKEQVRAALPHPLVLPRAGARTGKVAAGYPPSTTPRQDSRAQWKLQIALGQESLLR